MKNLRLVFKLSMQWLVSYSLILAPYCASFGPITAKADESQISESNEVDALHLDMRELLDRALYPTAPRSGVTGVPTSSEIAKIQARVMAVKHSYDLHLAARIGGLASVDDENSLVTEINTFYYAVQKFEELKLALGQPLQEETWKTIYSIQIPFNDLSQLYFVSTTAVFSQSYASLPGSTLDAEKAKKIEALKSTIRGFTSRLEKNGDQWILKLELNPSFVEGSENLILTSNPSTRNVLTYALLWSAHRLYDNYVITHLLQGQPLTSLREPSQAMRARFASLRLAREINWSGQRQLYLNGLKTAFFKAVLDSGDDLHKQNLGWSIDQDFLDQFATFSGKHLQVSNEIREKEWPRMQSAILAVLNLLDLNDWRGQTDYLIYASIRLALRWNFLYPTDPNLQTPPEAKVKVAALIDTQARKITDQFLNQSSLKTRIQTALFGYSWSRYIAKMQTNFQLRLQAAAETMRDFRTRTINLSYLFSAQRRDIEALQPGPFVATVIQGLHTQSSYETAYGKYHEVLVNYLRGFKFDQPPKDSLRITDLIQTAETAKWAPENLSGLVDAKYLSALSANPADRVKDLKDLLALGKILKFANYENMPANSSLTPNSLKVNDNPLSFIFGSEKSYYFRAMRDDLTSAAPLLGAELGPNIAATSIDDMGGNSTPALLWEYLADPKNDVSGKSAVVDAQLAIVERRIVADDVVLDRELARLTSNQKDDLSAAGPDLSNLVTRASQLSLGIKSLGGFDTYFEEIRQELMLPGLIGRQWQQFDSWSASAFYVLMGFMALQLVTTKLKFGVQVTNFIAQIFGTAFGVNATGLNAVFLSTMFVPIFGKAIDGFVVEPAHEATINNFFSCGSDKPCVALYSDLTQQQDITAAARSELVTNAAFLIAIVLGFSAGSYFLSKIPSAPGLFAARALKRQLAVLGLDESSMLSPEALNQATLNAIAKASVLKDPVAREVAVTYAKQARNRIELSIWKEALFWNKLDRQFQADAHVLGIDSREYNWKDLNVLRETLQHLNKLYDSGQVSTFNYRRLRQTLADMDNAVQSAYAQMARDPMAANFMNRVWDSAYGVSPARIRASIEFYNSFQSLAYQHAIHDFMQSEQPSSSTRSYDQLLNNLAASFERDPVRASQSLESTLSYFRRAKVSP